MGDYTIQARGLSVGYDGAAVLTDMRFDIRQGEIVALVGPNGAGKSTVLKSIARQLKLISGSVAVAGRDVETASPAELARELAVLLTERVRPELMTCREVVAMGRYPYTGHLGILSSQDWGKVDAAMAAVGVTELAQRDLSAISDGQRQRVMLARAICQEPKVLLLDEPTSYLDIHHKIQLLGLLGGLCREEGMTVLMSLHELDLAQKSAHRLMGVKGDGVAFFCAPEEMTERQAADLYGLTQGSYDPLFGSVELPGPAGEAQVFVLSSGGRGVPVYRRLVRQGVPFAAGVLHENDVDYHIARRLAAEVVSERPFYPLSQAALDRAMSIIRAVPRVIDAGTDLGPMNDGIITLIQCAKDAGKYETIA